MFVRVSVVCVCICKSKSSKSNQRLHFINLKQTKIKPITKLRSLQAADLVVFVITAIIAARRCAAHAAKRSNSWRAIAGTPPRGLDCLTVAQLAASQPHLAYQIVDSEDCGQHHQRMTGNAQHQKKRGHHQVDQTLCGMDHQVGVGWVKALLTFDQP